MKCHLRIWKPNIVGDNGNAGEAAGMTARVFHLLVFLGRGLEVLFRVSMTGHQFFLCPIHKDKCAGNLRLQQEISTAKVDEMDQQQSLSDDAATDAVQNVSLSKNAANEEDPKVAYESDMQKSIMELYMQNIEHGRMILESVEHGPFIWPTIEENSVTRTKKYEELSATKKIQADRNLKATNIIRQGLPSDVYSLVNHHRVTKDL
nr:CCR4-Not complex, subunit 3/ 5 [Tanacetum cinerariifolium]